MDSRLRDVLLLTGATGLVGSAVLRRLAASPCDAWCATRAGSAPSACACSSRSATCPTRLLRAAERAGAERFVWVTPLGAAPHHDSRVHRAKALAAHAVAASGLRTTTLASSLVYAPGDRRIQRLERLALLLVVPLLGAGGARTQPIWADDIADCIVRVLEVGEAAAARYELAGPEVLTHRDVARIALRAAHRRRRLLPVPLAVARPLLHAHEALAGPTAFATWDEAQLLTVSMLTAAGTADAERLGVRPRRMADVLGAT